MEADARGALGRSRFSKREKICPGGIAGGFLVRGPSAWYSVVVANLAKMKKTRGMHLGGVPEAESWSGSSAVWVAADLLTGTLGIFV